MASVNVQVQVGNAGSINLRVQQPGGSLNQQFTVTSGQPLAQTFTVAPGWFTVTVSWTAGYQNITPSISVDNRPIMYQVVGEPKEGGQIFSMVGVVVT